MKLLLVGALLSAAAVTELPPRYTVYGHGAQSCGRWVADRHEEGWPAFSREAWLLGFVSGVGYGSPELLGKTDADEVSAWVDVYCAAHPLESLASAAQVLVRELETPEWRDQP